MSELQDKLTTSIYLRNATNNTLTSSFGIVTKINEKENVLQITCLGNRYNGFGQLHMMGDDLSWVGPNSWRTEGTSWTDTYQVKPMGILSAPLLILD